MPKAKLHLICLATLVLASATTAGLQKIWQCVFPSSSATRPLTHDAARDPRAPERLIPVPGAAKRDDSDPASAACRARWQQLLGQPELPGAPRFEAARAEIMARAKAEPLIFLRAPEERARRGNVTRLRERLFRDGVPWQVLGDVFAELRRAPKLLREVLLTDGYLYTDKPDLAALLSTGISLHQLFDERELDVTRGTLTRRAVREHDEYVWADGAEAGQIARLWLLDRITPRGVRLSEATHVSVATLREDLGANRIEIARLVPGAALAQVFYGEHSTAAVFAIDGARFKLECEAVPPSARQHIDAIRSFNQRRRAMLERLQQVVLQQVDEALPFDEPKTEEGQQDGKLRSEWRMAYLAGQHEFEFNGDKYPVFGRGGSPRTPQVCVDFITDTWERMAGTRWAKRDEGRVRLVGRLDFNAVDITNRRSVEHLIDFAVAHPEWFELLLIPESERVPFASRAAFFRRLFDLRADFQPGDVVAILGLRDDEKLHYHSFFVFADDPLTAMPTLVASNAGRPRVRTWEGEMQNAPRRSVMARIRPRLEWLERVVGVESTASATMAKL
jgi:hypothetical protein